jgi:ectoine hydroxylase-related dioxygenase (phytanoyl-CoA dioxygenase family)
MSLPKLSKEQLEEYGERGFVAIPDIFTRQELAEMDREIDRLCEQEEMRRAGKGYEGWIMQLGLRSEKTREFAEDERILSLIEEVVKPGIAIYSAKLTAKLPHTDIVCHWHQDEAYYSKVSQSDARMSVWMPLQDADERNGCLWVVPGSHRWGLQKHELKKGGTCSLSFNEEELDMSGAIPLPAWAGSIVLFHAMLWHSSKGNETDRIRRAFIVSYQEAIVSQGNKEQWKILRPA